MGTMQKKKMKNDENDQLSCGIYSSPAAARSPLQGWVGDRSILTEQISVYMIQISDGMV